MRLGKRHLAWLALPWLLLASQVSGAAELKLATWNLEWLTTSDRNLPPDVVPKRSDDIDLLRRYAGELDADVIAIQEVDGAAVAAREGFSGTIPQIRSKFRENDV